MSVRVWKLDRAGVISRLQAWADQLGQDPQVLAVLLFGSLARGEATAASDADVLIILRGSDAEFGDRMVHYKPVGLGIGVEVFPYTLEEAQDALRETSGVVGIALQEGHVLFAREHALADAGLRVPAAGRKP